MGFQLHVTVRRDARARLARPKAVPSDSAERHNRRAVIVKDAAERAGLEPAIFAGHSLRSGFLTSAAKRGASLFKMMDVSRHRSVDTLRGYVRGAELLQDHASADLL
jgi:site-specific recombinase XerD